MTAFSEQILEEIGLEGLEGITLPTLWLLLGTHLKIPMPLPDSLQEEIWEFIKKSQRNLQFYLLPHKRETATLFDRFSLIDKELGCIISKPQLFRQRYKCVPIKHNEIMGSCQDFYERTQLQFSVVKNLKVKDIMKSWSTTFVIVGTQDLRYKMLAISNTLIPEDITLYVYVMLEAIGRSRYNGETTCGDYSLLNFYKDSIIVFYNKMKLSQHNLIKCQLINEMRNGHITSTTLITLPQFYKPRSNRYLGFIEKLYATVKNAPDSKMLLRDAIKVGNITENGKIIKRITSTYLFSLIFEIQLIQKPDDSAENESKIDQGVDDKTTDADIDYKKVKDHFRSFLIDLDEKIYQTENNVTSNRSKKLKTSVERTIENEKCQQKSSIDYFANALSSIYLNDPNAELSQLTFKDCEDVCEAKYFDETPSLIFSNKIKKETENAVENIENTAKYNFETVPIDEALKEINALIAINAQSFRKQEGNSVVNSTTGMKTSRKTNKKSKNNSEMNSNVLGQTENDEEEFVEMRNVLDEFVYQMNENNNESDRALNDDDDDPTNRTQKLISLREPNKDIEEYFSDSNIDPFAKNDDDEFHDDRRGYPNMLVKDELYQFVSEHGALGCRHSKICDLMGLTPLTVRQLLKNMIATGIIKTYINECGRQRFNMYVTIENYETVKTIKDTNVYTINNIKCNDELPEVYYDNNLIALTDDSMTHRVREFVYSKSDTHRNKFTQRSLERKLTIIKYLNDHALGTFNDVRLEINKVEEQKGFRDEVCSKSIKRLICGMQEKQLIHAYVITLKLNEYVRIYYYITHPKIDTEHEIFDKEIRKIKHNFYLSIEERRLRIAGHEVACMKALMRKTKIRKNKKLKDTKEKFKDNLTKELYNLNTNLSPKFLVARYLHEFLFYIGIEVDEKQQIQTINEELLLNWQKTEPVLHIHEYMSTIDSEEIKPIPYRRHISWRTFIPPMPTYPQKPRGWLSMNDAIECMPLSIFYKIFHIDKDADELLSQYLSHPIQQHYIVRQLPACIQRKINSTYLARIYINILKVLNNMGLVRVNVRKTFKQVLWVYINRRAKLLDTTTTEPGYDKISPNREYTVEEYYFDKLNDVQQYWTTLQRICVYTKLGFLHKRQEPCGRAKDLQFVALADFEEAANLDDGSVVGERNGAAGLPSILFAHKFRNWSWVVQNQMITRAKRTGRTKIIKNPEDKHFRCLRIPQMNPIKVMSICHRPTARNHKRAAAIKGTAAAGAATAAGASSSNAKKVNKKKLVVRDSIDHDALKNMRALRVSWSKEESKMLKLARAVFIYISAPMPIFGIIAMGTVCRDVLRHNLGSFNKTSKACGRRIQFIMRMNQDVPEVPTWVHILQTNTYIQSVYGKDFLKRLKIAYPNRKQYIDALTKHFISIYYFLYKIVYKSDNDFSSGPTHNAYAQQAVQFAIPNTIAEFQKRYQIRIPFSDNHTHYTNPKTLEDLQIDIILNVLHSSLCCVKDKTHYNYQAFEIYKYYSEEILQDAFKKARRDGLVVPIKRKNIQSIPTQMAGPAYIFSLKYRSRLMVLKIPYSTYDSLYAYLQNAKRVCTNSVTDQVDAKKGANEKKANTLVLKSLSLDNLIFMGENLSRRYLQLTIKLPKSILTIDAAEKRQGLSSVDRILDHYHNILQNAPETKYSKNYEKEAVKRKVLVKIPPDHLTIKIPYSAFEFLSKLPTRYLHFFCALNKFNQEVHINFNDLMRTVDDRYEYSTSIHDEAVAIVPIVVEEIKCPFECIMLKEDYFSAIERIVHENAKNIEHLENEMTLTSQELNHTLNDGNFKLDSTNFLTLIRMLYSYWSDKERQRDCKDFGKFESKVQLTKPIEWLQICKDILNYNPEAEDNEPDDEYEPKLHREERIARAQDAFVINLPTIEMRLRAAQQTPELWLENETERANILQKITEEVQWIYTTNSIETLQMQLTELNYNANEQVQLRAIHDFIESNRIGVSVEELIEKFNNKEFLVRALHTLAGHFLVKRVGIASYMYVHKNYIRDWVVHTFRLTRLKRENLGSSAMPLPTSKHPPDDDDDGETVSKKPKLSTYDQNVSDIEESHNIDNNVVHDDYDEEEQASACKRIKLSDNAEENAAAPYDDALGGQRSKRISKPVIRFDPTDQTKNELGHSNEIIVLKPTPWIRLTGTLNRRVLDRWLGAILSECIGRLGCQVHDIFLRFPHMPQVELMFLLEILTDLKCIHLVEIEKQEITLFSSFAAIKENIVRDLYDPKCTYIKVHPDAIMRLTQFIGKKLYSNEFVY